MKRFFLASMLVLIVLSFSIGAFAVPIVPCTDGGTCSPREMSIPMGNNGCIYEFLEILGCPFCYTVYCEYGTYFRAVHLWNPSGFCGDCGSRLD